MLICRHPSDNTINEISISEIGNVHWDNISGGTQNKSGSYSLYGYIEYSLAAKLVKCSGRHDYGYNQAKICIPKRANSSSKYMDGYKELLKQAGDPPPSIISQNRPKNAPPCTKAILGLLKNSDLTRGELRQLLLVKGYQSNTILNAIRSLQKNEKIITKGSNYSKYQIIKTNTK